VRSDDKLFTKLGVWYFSHDGFNTENPKSEYDAKTKEHAVEVRDTLRDLVSPDFNLAVEGTRVVLTRVTEKYFKRGGSA
jgi:hypothetical protein